MITGDIRIKQQEPGEPTQVPQESAMQKDKSHTTSTDPADYSNTNVLLIEHSKDDARLIMRTLAAAHLLDRHVTHALGLVDALKRLSESTFDIILIDIDLPESQSLSMMAELRSAAHSVPVIALSGLDNEALAVEIVGRGAQDYLIKEQMSAHRLGHAIRFALERRRTEEQAAFLAAIVESSDDAIIGKTLDGTVVSWNAGAERLYGYTADEVIGLPVSIIMPPDRKDDLPEILRRIVSGERVSHFETVRMRKDGQLLNVSLTVSPIKDKSGRITAASAVARDITERKRLEEQLRQSAEETRLEYEKLATLVANVDVSMIMFDTEGRYALVNECWVRRNRMTPEMVIGRRYDEVSNNTDHNHVQQAIDMVLSTGEPFTLHEFYFQTKALPEGVYIEGSIQAIRDRTGAITGAMAVSIDVTDRVLARQEIEATNALLSSVVSEAPVGIVVYDRDMRIMQLNAEYARLARFDMEEVKGQVLYDVAPYTLARKTLHKQVLSGESIDEQSVPHQFPDEAQLRYSDIRYRPLRGADGKVTGMLSTVIDVSERTGAVKDLETQTSLLEAFVQATPVGLVYFDLKMHILSMNSTYAQMTHLDPETAIGHVLYDVQTWIQVQDREKLHMRVLTGEVVDTQHIMVQDPLDKKQHSYDVYFRPVRQADGTISGMVCAVIDVTERHELDQRKDEFLSLTSHELRTPVTIIKGFAQLALNNAMRSGDERQIRALKGINDQAGHLTRIITDLLDVTRIESGTLPMHRETFDIGELVRDIVNGVQLTAPELEATVALPAEPAIVHADRHLIYEVLTNLIDNAIKYSADECRVVIGVTPVDDEVMVSVQDYGLGIPAEEQAKVFDRFYRATNAGQHPRNGLGLGLFISRGIIERHGGRMWLESKKEVGSTFYFSLPVGA
ncbi:MAG: PAS domain S-box protein [Chloroflexota bacterium]